MTISADAARAHFELIGGYSFAGTNWGGDGPRWYAVWFKGIAFVVDAFEDHKVQTLEMDEKNLGLKEIPQDFIPDECAVALFNFMEEYYRAHKDDSSKEA